MVIQFPLINDDVIYEPAYTIAQAARLARMPSVTVRRWILGYEYADRRMKPVFGVQQSAQEDGELEPMLSFIQLSELVVANRFRQGEAAQDIPGQKRVPMPLKRIRAAHDYARTAMGVDYPFAYLKLQDQGGHILHEFEAQATGGPKGHLALDAGGNWVLPELVVTELHHFKYQEDGMAAEWYPLGTQQPIRLNPRVRGGQPTVVKTGVTISTIISRIDRGEKREIVAYDYGMDLSSLEAAVTAARRYLAA